MMPVVMYETEDGTRFSSAKHAGAYETLSAKVDSIILPLGLALDCDRYCNGDGFVQHDPSLRGEMLAGLVGLGANRDSAGPLGRALNRIYCIDPKGREFGQPYFALNPGEAKMIDRTAEVGR